MAFAGPHDVRSSSPEGYYTLCPDDYIPYFKKRGVQRVVRLNKKYYDERRFTGAGFKHTDLYYLDGSNPPEKVLRTFLETCERTKGAIAVHCKAGLGRTGSCIGAYLMKHHGFTAKEVIGWLRVCRPGSVIGPQQQFLESIQGRMWKEGKAFRIANGGGPAPGVHGLRSPWEALDRKSSSAAKAVGEEEAGGGRGKATGGGASSSALAKGGRASAARALAADSSRAGGRPGAIGVGVGGSGGASKSDLRSHGSLATVSGSSRAESGGTGSFGSTTMLDGPGTPASVASDASQGDFLRSAKGRLAAGGTGGGLGSSFGRSPLAGGSSSRRTLAAGGSGLRGGGGGGR